MQRSRCLPAIDRDGVDAVRRDVHREIFRLRAVARVQLRAVRRGDRQLERAFFHGKMDLQHITFCSASVWVSVPVMRFAFSK